MWALSSLLTAVLLHAATLCASAKTAALDSGHLPTKPYTTHPLLQETAMGGLPSLLTAVLLHAAPSCAPVEAIPERLPRNFVDAATAVMRVLNNVAR